MRTKEIKELKNELKKSENEEIRDLYHVVMYEFNKTHFLQFQTVFFLAVIIFLLIFIGSTFWSYEPVLRYLVEHGDVWNSLIF